MRVKGNRFDVIWVFYWTVKRLEEYGVIGRDSSPPHSFQHIDESIISLTEHAGEGLNIFVREEFGPAFGFESELRDLALGHRWELEKVSGEDELDTSKRAVIVADYTADVIEFIEEWSVNHRDFFLQRKSVNKNKRML